MSPTTTYAPVAEKYKSPADGGQSQSHGPPNVGSLERLASLAGGIGLGLVGLKRGGLGGLTLGLLGGSLVYRGFAGKCYCYQALGISTAQRSAGTGVPAQLGVRLNRSITINRPANDIYRKWRDLEKLPEVMQHLNSVEVLSDKRSRWTALGPFSKTLEWEAEIVNEHENELLAWRSIPGGDVDTAGSIRLEPLKHNRGTQVSIELKYNPPGGKLAAYIASWLGAGLEQKLDEDLRRFKQVVETGVLVTTTGQPRGQSSSWFGNGSGE